ncbi:MAG: hypothetical protein Q8877_03200 [Sweet potato little leaf phytoplasma]|nr:hypothetical protein [Sweet potato little leaf phytoplasma]
MHLCSAGNKDILQFDPEIELSAKRKKKQAQQKQKEQAKKMAERENTTN